MLCHPTAQRRERGRYRTNANRAWRRRKNSNKASMRSDTLGSASSFVKEGDTEKGEEASVSRTESVRSLSTGDGTAKPGDTEDACVSRTQFGWSLSSVAVTSA